MTGDQLMAGSSEGEASPIYEMTVDLSVLESLGINLYSNAAAVLSELVANAYDADSNQVSISWKQDASQDHVVVTDDGAGMTVSEINRRFLTVGYKKRDHEGVVSTKFARPYMGRKGIGKLSVFSIAQEVSIYSTKNGVSSGLTISVKDLEAAIKAKQSYYPVSVNVPPEFESQGTTLVLANLKSKRADLTANALRKRLARRFDVIDQRKPEDGGFVILVNDTPITYADRQELKNLEFIWEFGESRLPDSALPKHVKRFVLKDDVIPGHADWKVGGWIGTARQPSELTDDKDAGSLKNVIVLARKRPIQEGIIEKLDFSRVFGSYVTGQIEADFLDLDEGYEDIATSDRQRLIEDDPRVSGLQRLLREAFKEASEIWTEERPKKVTEDILDRFPRLKQWVEERPPYQEAPARKMIGTIAGLTIEKDNEVENRATLLRAGVLAFERIGIRQTSEELDALSTATPEGLLALLGRQDTYEAALWGDILRSRVDAISQFRNLTRDDEKEKVLQEALFKDLWLLDPSWERATLSPRMEQNLREVAEDTFAKDPEDEEITGRLDIHYVTNGGRHVIVELKRFSVHDDVAKYVVQGQKYYDALKSILDQQQEPNPAIEVVFVLGRKPKVKRPGALGEDEFIEVEMSKCNGRYVLYDRLIAGAQSQYEQYLDASERVVGLNGLLDSLSAPETDTDSL